ncbi:hypothetical protein BASA60_011146 [Batrachochytrium salamandrivorans]|nr:hypothetical protein BASA60_011146 [Batrachochytrium salamandrivorans]
MGNRLSTGRDPQQQEQQEQQQQQESHTHQDHLQSEPYDHHPPQQRTPGVTPQSTQRARLLRRQLLPVNPLVPTSVLRFLGLRERSTGSSTTFQNEQRLENNLHDQDHNMDGDDDDDGGEGGEEEEVVVVVDSDDVHVRSLLPPHVTLSGSVVAADASTMGSHPYDDNTASSARSGMPLPVRLGVSQRRSMRPLLASQQSRMSMRSVTNTVGGAMQSFPAGVSLGAVHADNVIDMDVSDDTDVIVSGSGLGLPSITVLPSAATTTTTTTTAAAITTRPDDHDSHMLGSDEQPLNSHSIPETSQDTHSAESSGNSSSSSSDDTSGPEPGPGEGGLLDGALQHLLRAILSTLPPHLIPGAVIQPPSTTGTGITGATTTTTGTTTTTSSSEADPSHITNQSSSSSGPRELSDASNTQATPPSTQSPARRPPLVILALRAPQADTAAAPPLPGNSTTSIPDDAVHDATTPSTPAVPASSTTAESTQTEQLQPPPHSPWIIYVMSQGGDLLMRIGTSGTATTAVEGNEGISLSRVSLSQQRSPPLVPTMPYPPTAGLSEHHQATPDIGGGGGGVAAAASASEGGTRSGRQSVESSLPSFNPFGMLSNSLLSGMNAAAPTWPPSLSMSGDSRQPEPAPAPGGAFAGLPGRIAQTGGISESTTTNPLMGPFSPTDRRGLANVALPLALSLMMRMTQSNAMANGPSLATPTSSSTQGDTLHHHEGDSQQAASADGSHRQSSHTREFHHRRAGSSTDDTDVEHDPSMNPDTLVPGPQPQSQPNTDRRPIPGLGGMGAGIPAGGMMTSLLLQTLLGAAISGSGETPFNVAAEETLGERPATRDDAAPPLAASEGPQRRSQGLDYEMLLRLGDLLGPARRMNAQQHDVDTHIPTITYKNAGTSVSTSAVASVASSSLETRSGMNEAIENCKVEKHKGAADNDEQQSKSHDAMEEEGEEEEHAPTVLTVQDLLGETHEKCTICLSAYAEDDQLRVLSCRHGFHKDCLDQWLVTYRNSCPICRAKGVETTAASDTHEGGPVPEGMPAGVNNRRALPGQELPNAILFVLS